VSDWKDLLNGDPTEWLLESEDPSLRYRTLVDLLDADRNGSEALDALDEAMRGGPVDRVLRSQHPDGHWGREEDFYNRSKYRGTVWNVILLAELGADPRDERVRRAGEFILRWSQRSDGGFSHRGAPAGEKGLALYCLSGNMVWALSRLGFGDDPRILKARERMVAVVRNDRSGFSAGRCVPCRSGAVKMLKALHERVGSDDEAAAVSELRERVIRECFPGQGRGPRPEWNEVWFPLFWNTDLVEILELLGRTGGLVQQANGALMSVLSKQDDMGRWAQERSYRGRCLVSFEPPGRPSRWATLRVLRMLKHVAP
jgi:hypothetical protein